MEPLRSRDVRAAFELAGRISAGEFAGDVRSLLAALGRLVGCDTVEHADLVVFMDEPEASDPTFEPTFTGLPHTVQPARDRVQQMEIDRNDSIRWFRERTGSVRAVRTSDVESYLRSVGVDVVPAPRDEGLQYRLTMRVARPVGRPSAFSMERDARDFVDRDVALLESMRPFLAVNQQLTSLRAAPGSAPLTSREHRVLDLVAAGSTNRQIAQRLAISPATVKKHLEHVFAKLEVSNRTEACAKTGRAGTPIDPATLRPLDSVDRAG